jgi:hypothetical protein
MSLDSEKFEITLSQDDADRFDLDKLTLKWGVSKYLDSYPKLLLEFMVIEKGSLTAFCAVVGCSSTTINKWMASHPALKDAYEVGKAYRSWSYEKLLFDCAKGKIKGNFSAIKFALMNYAGDDFKDKQEIEHSGNVVFSIDTGIKRPGDLQEGQALEGEILEDEIEEAEFSEISDDPAHLL